MDQDESAQTRNGKPKTVYLRASRVCPPKLFIKST
jgi:hypothetical protein